MDFSLNDIQQELANTAREFGSKHSPVERLRKMRKDDIGWSPELWTEMAGLGWLMAPFAEELGGIGGNFVEAALVLEQFGRTLIPEPYTTFLVAGKALEFSGSSAQHEQFLAPLLSGDKTLALAWAERHRRFDFHHPQTQATASDGGYTLKGEKIWVLHGHHVEQLLVSAAIDGGVGLFVVDADAAGLERRAVATMDSQRAAHIRLDGVQVPAEHRLGEGDQSEALSRAFDIGAAATVAEGLGVAQRSFEMTLEYLNTREQFGTKIGAFQALQHRAVDMFVEVELLRSINMASMVKVDDPEAGERQRWVSAAKGQLIAGGRYVVQDAVQLHGGIGVTDEHDIGLYFKRMHTLNALYGDGAYHNARFASLGGLESAA